MNQFYTKQTMKEFKQVFLTFSYTQLRSYDA